MARGCLVDTDVLVDYLRGRPAAEESGAELVTLNQKHFPWVKALKVPYRK